MELPEGEGWITSPEVIDMLCAMNEIRPGDQIVFTRQPGTRAHTQFNEGAVITLMLFPPDALVANRRVRGTQWGGPDEPVLLTALLPASHMFTRSYIKAWRRPTK
jgi:hypothetical protein